MKLSKNCDISVFSHLWNRNDKNVHSIKLIIDDIMIDVNRIVLNWWTCEFGKCIEDDEIFLTEFLGMFLFVFLVSSNDY